MNDLKKNPIWIIILRWIARIWAVIAVAFLLFMIVGHLFGESEGVVPTFSELVEMIFFLVGIPIGLIIALKLEFIGGIITVFSLLGFHVAQLINSGQFEFDVFIDFLALPGFLFVICWYFHRKYIGTEKAT